jgi:hypothetical protein
MFVSGHIPSIYPLVLSLPWVSRLLDVKKVSIPGGPTVVSVAVILYFLYTIEYRT